MEAEQVKRLYRVWKTLLTMLSDRGYCVPEDFNVSNVQEFREKKLPEQSSKETLEFQVTKLVDPEEKLLVVFPSEPKIKVPYIAQTAQRMLREEIQRSLIVANGTLTPTAKQAISDLATHFVLEFFEEKELLVNITEHELVPRHLVMNDHDKALLLNRYKLKESQLPKIQVSDPIARYLGLKPGQVVKIIRNSETAGKYITYRMAI